MHAATAFRWRNTLDAVPTGLGVKTLDASTCDCDGKKLMPRAQVGALARASFSTHAVSEAKIGGGEFGHELLGVGATLGGAYL